MKIINCNTKRKIRENCPTFVKITQSNYDYFQDNNDLKPKKIGKTNNVIIFKSFR